MKYHIISIGISTHQNPEANLQYASKDASDFFSLFTQNVTNVGYNKLLTDNEATLSAIQTALGNELQNQVGTDDGFVLFYSGHGALAPDQNNGFTHYLVPFDVTEDISNSSIPVEYIRGIFNKLNCKSKLFFVDSCFSGAINSKSYGPSYKSVKNIKKLSEEISGEGSVVFTACQDEEKSIEDDKLKNGVFTSFLLAELQENKNGEKFSIINIFTPIAEKVSEYTQQNHHFKQTPTFKGTLKDILYLPVFKKPLLVKPDIIDTPKSQDVVDQVPISPEIDLTQSKQKDLTDETIQFVLRTTKEDRLSKLEFEKFALELGNHIIKKWEAMFQPGGTVHDVPEKVAKLEAESYQLMVLAAAVGAYGNTSQARLLAEICGELIKSTKEKSGLIAMIHVPEVIVVFVEYILTLTAVATVDFTKLRAYMDTQIFGLTFDREPPTLLSMYHTHYADALTGSADKVAEYVRKGLKAMAWLRKIHPRLNLEDMDLLHIRANYILVTLRTFSGYRGFPDFGHFYSSKLFPLIDRIKYDDEFIKSFAHLFKVEPKELRPKLIQIINELHAGGLGSEYFWNSIDGDDFLTKKEVDERERQKRERQAAQSV